MHRFSRRHLIKMALMAFGLGMIVQAVGQFIGTGTWSTAAIVPGASFFMLGAGLRAREARDRVQSNNW